MCISKQRGGAESDVYKLVKMCTERDFAPAIVFSFSRKDCESYALEAMRLDLNSSVLTATVILYLYLTGFLYTILYYQCVCSDDEKKLVEEVFKNAVDTLSPEDQLLPQVQT